MSFVSAGGTPERSNPTYWQNGNIPWLKISDVTSSNKYVRKCSEYITEEGMNNSSAKILPKGTILYTIFATIGEVGILDFNATCNQAIAGIQTFNTDINDYLYYYLVNLQDFMKSISKGCAQFNINQKILKSAFVPLPPLEEQKRIVDELKKFEPLIADYDKLEQQATKLDSEIYDKLKKSILQYAIQGKLVEQDETDEPASILLERIRAEKKAQLGKKYVESYIYKGDDNCYYEKVNNDIVNITEKLPFTIPDSWSWSRIQQISDSYIGLTYKPTDVVKDYGNIVLRSSNIQNGEIDFSDIVRVNVEISEKLKVNKNDIIICARNGSKKLVGKSALVKVDMDNLTFGAFMAICKTPLYDYVSKFLLSPLFFEQLATVSGTTTINQLTQASFNSFFIPIPPLLEQQRIIKQLDLIFNKLKAEN